MQSLLELLHVYIHVVRVDEIWHSPTIEVVLSHTLFSKAFIFIDLAEGGKLNLAAMVSNHLPLADVNEAFRAMEAAEGIRTVLVP